MKEWIDDLLRAVAEAKDDPAELADVERRFNVKIRPMTEDDRSGWREIPINP